MSTTAYGNFHDFCRDSGSLNPTLPVCWLFSQATTRGGQGFGGCDLTGIPLSGNRNLANLGSILLDGLTIVILLGLMYMTNKKKAAVGRREMLLFLIGLMIISICEIFTVGGFPLDSRARRVFAAIHIASIISTAWILLLNAVVAFQLIDDGTPLSVGLVLVSAAALFIGTGYIALDTGFSWTGFFDSTLTRPNRSYSLYTLYQLVPLVFIVAFFVLMLVIIAKVLLAKRPMYYLIGSALCFAIGQIFQYVISVHICNGVNGHINGGFFQVLFNLAAYVLVWLCWDGITEDDWPTGEEDGYIPHNVVDDKGKNKDYN